MVKEVIILLNESDHKSKTGSVFESLVRSILETQQYEVTQNLHITGLEIDLFAQHKIKNELLYAECKAKEKPKSDEIKKFIFSVDYGINDKKPDYAYFIHTQELDRQAAGLKIQLEETKRNVTFIGPEKIFELLSDSQKVKPYEERFFFGKEVLKLILVYSNHGYFYVPIIQDGNVPQFYSVLNAKTLTAVTEIVLEDIKKQLKEVADLEYIALESQEPKPDLAPPLRDTVVPIRESENWFDYTPASFHHFIGRMGIRRNLKGFLEKIRTKRTQNRIFFLDGKSGWGKSSILAELKGSSQELRYWKGRISVLAVDTRSANSANFVGLAFKKLVSDSVEDGFLDNDIFKEIKISSPYDILSDQTIKQLFLELKAKKRLLVLVFDQFEDQFRKEKLFDAFYRFCLDVDSIKENLVVGFSWKSEINIPLGNPAYHKFNQLKDFAYKITVPEFSQNDALQIIKQLEKTIGEPLGNELERKLIESSQGFPWFIKKLCIHTLKQFDSGKSVDEISEAELNCKDLFEYDLLNLTGEEKKALDYVAQRAFDGSPFEISEFDKISQETIDVLINKRLIIRTGSTYNIYWDIFRDYVVTKKMPIIGESYILRQSGRGCLNAFLAFNNGRSLSISDIAGSFPYEIADKSLFNILLELRSIGLIRKLKGQDVFELTNKTREVTESFFKEYITEKFKNYTPLLELEKINKSKIELTDIISVLKSIFKTESFEEETWEAYAKNLLIWFNLSNLEIKNRLVELRRGRGAGISSISDRKNQIPFYSPSLIIKEFENFIKNKEVDDRKFRDFLLFELVTVDEDILIDPTKDNIIQHLSKKAEEMHFIKHASDIVRNVRNIKSDQFIIECPEIFENYNTQVSKRQRATIILAWAQFLVRVGEGKWTNQITRSGNSSGKYYLTNSPEKVLNLLGEIDAGQVQFTKDARKLRDLQYIGLVNLDGESCRLTDLGLTILNSQNPEKELAGVANSNSAIAAFRVTFNMSDKKRRKRSELLEVFQPMFPGLLPSSTYTKISIYNSWNKFISLHLQES
ncbi:MAG: restriction endonuclease [Bacteroidia bacterium]|jgi:hypothetical protein|nr:restriction endonuclease [Bacteroidia bacterium]